MTTKKRQKKSSQKKPKEPTQKTSFFSRYKKVILVLLLLLCIFSLLAWANRPRISNETPTPTYTPVHASDKKSNQMTAQLTVENNQTIAVASWIQNGLLTLEVSGTLPPLEKDQEYRLWISNGEKFTYAGKLVRSTATDWKGLFRLGSNFYSYNSLLLERVNKNTPRNTPSNNIIARGQLKKKSQ